MPIAILNPLNLDIYCAKGAHINILSCMTVQLHITGMCVFADLFVSDDILEFMLGYDWLVAQGVHWYFDRKVILLGPAQS